MKDLISESELNLFSDLRYVSDIVVLCLSTWSIFANGTVIVVYLVMKRLHKKTTPNFMLFNQAIVDVIIALYALLSTLPNYFNTWMQERHYNIARIILGDYSIFLALGILVLSSGERSLAIHKPFLHFRNITLCRIFFCILVVWILSFIPCAVLIFYTKPEGHIATNEFYIIYGSFRVGFVIVGIITVLVVLCFCYRSVRKSIRDSQRTSSLKKRIKSEDENLLDEENKKELRYITLLIVMSIVYALSYLPMGIFSIVRSVASESLSFFEMLVIEIVVFILYVISAVVDPIFTLFIKDDFKGLIFRHCNYECGRCKCKKINEEQVSVRIEILSTDETED